MWRSRSRSRKRKIEDLTLNRQGPYTDHEDFIHGLLGEEWQDTALNSNIQSWLKLCRQLTHDYLKKHKLPTDPRATPKIKHNRTTESDDKANTDTDESYLRTEGLNEPWQHNRSCCNIISDNQLLVDIITHRPCSQQQRQP